MGHNRPLATSQQTGKTPSPRGEADVPPTLYSAQSPGWVQSPERVTQPQLPMFDPLQALLREHADTFRPDFAAWLALNRHVWDAFVREADKLWNRGRRHYGARTVIEHLRHESAIAETGSEFKINNDRAPCMSRLYRLVYPDRVDLFDTRVMPGSRRVA